MGFVFGMLNLVAIHAWFRELKRSFGVLVFLATLGFFPQGAAVAVEFPVALLPFDKPVEARLMSLAMSAEGLKLIQRIQAALASQPDWAIPYLDSAPRGQPLPYHPRLRISEAEYKVLLDAMRNMRLIQMGTLRLRAHKEADGWIRIATEPSSLRLNGLLISPDENAVKSSSVVMSDVRIIDNQDANSPTGRWAGKQWRHENYSSTEWLMVKLAIGRRENFGDGILYLDWKQIQKDARDDHYEIVLFPVPQ